jgi:hypothetical protein
MHPSSFTPPVLIAWNENLGADKVSELFSSRLDGGVRAGNRSKYLLYPSNLPPIAIKYRQAINFFLPCGSSGLDYNPTASGYV